ncbi:MAG: membrane integrity-associated transporter subunit PqiC [Acetobacteraceae bacterium]|nr:membrane integrity-associated transporter subunit PqiC [Acetobacteraceae bacterium]
MRRRVLLAATLGLGGCGLSERPYLERRQWPLVVARPVSLPPRRGGRVLLVRTIRAAPGLDARGLQSLRPDGSLDTSFYEEWSVPPAQAIEDDLRRWLAGSGAFAAVIGPGSRLAADFVLEGDLNAFWADLASGRARVTLGIVLLEQHDADTTVRMQRSFTGDAPLAGTDAAARAAALRASLADVLHQIEAAVTAAAATNGRRRSKKRAAAAAA